MNLSADCMGYKIDGGGLGCGKTWDSVSTSTCRLLSSNIRNVIDLT